MIGTWRMILDGILKGQELLINGGDALDSVEVAINDVENNKLYMSVGFGGLPNFKGAVELDAGIMDGDKFSIGCIGAIKNYKNPISIARKLMDELLNNFLVADGAELFAKKSGFKKDKLQTKKSVEKWKAQKKLNDNNMVYQGHDTVSVVSLDKYGKIVAGTSTSGLFMKKPGRVGDSPIVGSGFYADSNVGGACSTGLGENIMKGVVSYEVVKLMDAGLSPQAAAEKAVNSLSRHLISLRGNVSDISIVCMNKSGEWGAATNAKHFSFVVAEKELYPQVYIATYIDEKLNIKKASLKWINSNLE